MRFGGRFIVDIYARFGSLNIVVHTITSNHNIMFHIYCIYLLHLRNIATLWNEFGLCVYEYEIGLGK